MLVYHSIIYPKIYCICIRLKYPSLSDTPPMAGSEAPEDGAQLIIVISGEVASHSLRLTHDMGEEIKS